MLVLVDMTEKSQGQKRKAAEFRFVVSAQSVSGCPDDIIPEIAIVGRSNAGKSSLINLIAGRALAKVSSTPGKTRLLNFFEGKHYRLVDMPGYGFASRSGSEMKGWRAMVESFLASRSNLVGLVVVMDIRRDWTDDEQSLVDWLSPRALPLAVALTKADKLSRNELLKRRRDLERMSGTKDLFVTSALEKSGHVELEDFLFSSWVKPVLELRSEIR